MAYKRITVNPDQMGGVPCVRGLRIPVATVVAMVAEGMTEAEILQTLPNLEPEDIREALRFATEAVQERALPRLEDLEPEDGVFAVRRPLSGSHRGRPASSPRRQDGHKPPRTACPRAFARGGPPSHTRPPSQKPASPSS
jgi:uncharacterized protein (DUF433 family)